MRRDDRHLQKRGGRWHYVRRVPKRYQELDARKTIRCALHTESTEVARLRRDALEAADDEFWASLVLASDDREADYGEEGAGAIRTAKRQRERLERRYQAASARAIARGFVYTPVDDLARSIDVAELLDRLQIVGVADRGCPNAGEAAEAEALLGGVAAPPVTVSTAFETYCNEIAVGDLVNKSPRQKQRWLQTKTRAIEHFIDVVGDKPLADITRKDALAFHKWWGERLRPKGGRKPLQANTANRDLGNLRQLVTAYFKYVGEEDRLNPFRNLAFRDASPAEVPPFDDAWVRARILVPGVFDRLNGQAALIVYALIETGCRPSEITNLMPDDIRLDVDVPYIRIRPHQGREIKTAASIRDIPLVGVSLTAMRKAPEGFPHYRDKNDLLSASLMRAFRHRDLFPTDNHVIYSFRHSFEKRMLEAGLDYGLRCILMGHRNTRPAYGDGGSLAYRRDELLKIAHPFPEGLLERVRVSGPRSVH